jgi:hypothetical protein
MPCNMNPIEQAERFEKLAATIEEHEDQFDMSWWVQTVKPTGVSHTFDRLDDLVAAGVDLRQVDCSTRGCVAGWTVLSWPDEVSTTSGHTIRDAAILLLGLNDDYDTANWLFDSEATHQTAAAAAEVLRELAAQVRETGSTEGFSDSWA